MERRAEHDESALETIEADIEAVQEIVEEKIEEATESRPWAAVIYR